MVELYLHNPLLSLVAQLFFARLTHPRRTASFAMICRDDDETVAHLASFTATDTIEASHNDMIVRLNPCGATGIFLAA